MSRSEEAHQTVTAGQRGLGRITSTMLVLLAATLAAPSWALDIVLLGTDKAVEKYSVTNGAWASAGEFIPEGFAPLGPGSEITGPRGVTVDASTGNVYVGDRRIVADGFSTILELDADGNFIGYAAEESFGDFAGQVEALTIGPDGDLWFTVARGTELDGVYKTALPINVFPTVTRIIDTDFTLADSSLGRLNNPVDLEFVGNTLFVAVRGSDNDQIQPDTFDDTVYRFDMTDSSGGVAGLDTPNNAVKFWTGSNRPKGLLYDSANDRLLLTAHGNTDPSGGTAEVETSGILAFSDPVGTLPVVSPTDIYMVSNTGEIKQFTGIAAGANPLDGATFATGGVTVTTIAAYGAYQGFTMTPDGQIYGVNDQGGVDSWTTLTSWQAGDAPTVEAAAGTYGVIGAQGSLHGISYDGRTGGVYVVFEGDASIDGDIGEYPTLTDFIANTNVTITAAPFGGNITNFFYPGEDAPDNAGPNQGNSGANYFQITGGGQLEGWETLTGSVFGYVNPGQRTYQIPGFGNNVIGSFAVVTPNDLANLPTVIAPGTNQATPTDIAIFDGSLFVSDEGTDNILLIDEIAGTQTVVVDLIGSDNPTQMALLQVVDGSLWDGGATPGNSDWGTAANWASDVLPDFPSEPVLIFAGDVGLTPNNEVGGRTVSSVIFDSSAAAFDLVGQSFALTGSISNNSAATQTITAPINSQNALISAATEGLSLADLIASSGSTTLETAGTASLLNDERLVMSIDSLSGSGDVDVIGSGLVDLTGANPGFSGTINVAPDNTSVVLRVNDSAALGNASAGTTISAGGNIRLEIAGGLSISEPLSLGGRNAEDDLASAIVSLNGDNVLTGTIALVDSGFVDRSGLNFRTETDTLTITNPFALELDGQSGGEPLTVDLAVRGRGAGRLILNAAVVDDDNSSDAMSVYVGGSSVMELNGAVNTYSGVTRIDEAGLLDLDGTIPNTSEIALLTSTAVVDASDIGGLSLGVGQTLSGDGIVLGNVTAGNGSTIIPGQNAGVLSIDGGLTLENGSALEIEVGAESDLIDVTGALVGPGTNSSGITLTVGAAVPVVPGLNTTVIQAASVSNLTEQDFNVMVAPGLESLITGVNVTVMPTQVQLSFNVSDATISQVLTLGQNGNGFDVELWLVQGGFWTFDRDLITAGVQRGMAQDPTTGELFTARAGFEEDMERFDKSGFLLEVIGSGGVNPSERVEFVEIGPDGNPYYGTQPSAEPENEQVFKYDLDTQTWSTFAANTDGVNYALDLVRDIEFVGNRLFVASKGTAEIVEFDATTGAFVQIFDSTDIPQVSALTYDPNSDRLYVSCNIDNSSSRADDVKSYSGIAGNDGLPPTSEDIVFQTFADPNEDRNIHGILVLDGEIYISAQGGGLTVDGIYRIDNPGPSATTTLVAAADRTEVTVMIEADVSTGGRYDFDLDSDVEADDLDTLFGCLNGPDVNTPPAGCSAIDFAKSDGDEDGDVDVFDLDIFLQQLGQ